jgi:hypothetical protein
LETDMLNCQRLRGAVFLSAFLLIAGLVLEFAARMFAFPAPVMGLALFAGLAAVAILVIAFIAALLPGSAERLAECRK